MDQGELEELVCTICFHFFDDNEYCPRMIPNCGHTFCSRCLENLLNKLPLNGEFTCPDDRTTWCLSTRDINAFPKNFVLIRLIEKHRSQKNSNLNGVDNNLYNMKQIYKMDENRKNRLNNPLVFSMEFQPKNQGYLLDRQEIILTDPFPKSILNSKLCTMYDSANILLRGNHSILDSLQNTQTLNFEGNFCREHCRKLEIVCIDHKCRICTNCALFGSHKNHCVKAEEEVLKDIAQRAESLIDLFSTIEIKQSKLTNQDIIHNLNTTLHAKHEDINKLIQDKFQAYIEMIKLKERKILDELDNKFSLLEDKMKEFLQYPVELLQKISKWKYCAQDKLNVICERTEKQQIAFELLEDNPKNDLLATGSQLIKELEKANEAPMRFLEDTLNKILIIFNENFATSVESLCVFEFNNTDLNLNNKDNHNTVSSKCNNINSNESNLASLKSTSIINMYSLISNQLSTSNSSGNSTLGVINLNNTTSFPLNSNNNNNNSNNNTNITRSSYSANHTRMNSINSTTNSVSNSNSNNTNTKGIFDITKYKKSNETFINEKLDYATEESSINRIVKLDTIDGLSRLTLTQRTEDDDNDLLSMEFSNFGLTDIPDVSDAKTKQNFMNQFSFSIIPESNNNNQGNMAMINKTLIQNGSISKDVEESKSKIGGGGIIAGGMSTTPTKQKAVEKENKINKPISHKKKLSMRYPEKPDHIIDSLKEGNLDAIDITRSTKLRTNHLFLK